jgi:hypothetical protein
MPDPVVSPVVQTAGLVPAVRVFQPAIRAAGTGPPLFGLLLVFLDRVRRAR